MENEIVKRKIESYPDKARSYAINIRGLIYDTARQTGIERVEEDLKWGEPSFKVTGGSPVRMDWKEKTPDKFYLFFNCNTILVETFREIYSSVLKFEGRRAIVLDLSEKIPEKALRHCISLALKYHKLKKRPFLGV